LIGFNISNNVFLADEDAFILMILVINRFLARLFIGNRKKIKTKLLCFVSCIGYKK